MKDLMLLKLGGSLITKKNSKEPVIDDKNIERIAIEVKNGLDQDKNDLILIHGAGSFGHPIVKATGIQNGASTPQDFLALAETQKLQNELNVQICEIFLRHNLPVMPFQPSTVATMKNGQLINFDVNLLESFLNLSLIPVLYGVPAYDTYQNCSILSGDQIIIYLANKFSSSYKVVAATDVDGVLDVNNNVIKKVTSKSVLSHVKGAKNIDVTGGMAGKLKEFLKLKPGIKALIINGNIPKNIEKSLKGESIIGTLIDP